MQLLENPFLKNDLVDTMNFLEDLSIKDPSEKNRFFRGLPALMPAFPDVVCTRKLLPLIASALSYGGAPALALGCLLQVRLAADAAPATITLLALPRAVIGRSLRSIHLETLELRPRNSYFLYL